MNLDQMLVYQVENQGANALVHTLLLSQFCFGSICIYLVGLQYQRNSFVYLVVGDDHENTSFDVGTNDVEAADDCIRANRKMEGEVK